MYKIQDMGQNLIKRVIETKKEEEVLTGRLYVLETRKSTDEGKGYSELGK